jgi:hypothetical protein
MGEDDGFFERKMKKLTLGEPQVVAKQILGTNGAK